MNWTEICKNADDTKVYSYNYEVEKVITKDKSKMQAN